METRKNSESQPSVDLFKFNKSSIKKSLYICSFAFMMNYAAYGGLVFLQSSMNIENGLGTIGLFVVYATSAFSTIFFVPFLIDFMGAKTAIIAGELGITFYTIANFYPSWFTIIPAAIFHGVTESAAWAGSAVYVTYLGEKYWEKKLKPETKKESYVYHFISIFYVFIYMSQIVGNALVYLVLYGLKDINIFYSEHSVTSANGNVTYAHANNTSYIQESPMVNHTWDRCGAHECQSEFIYDEGSDQLKKYEPNPGAVYLLLGIFLGMQVIFTIVHALALPRIPCKFEAIQEKKLREASCLNENECRAFVPGVPKGISHFRNAIKTELIQTWRHVISPLHLMVFPFLFYTGVLIVFGVTEFTRAYVSCTIGVEQVGLVIVVYATTSMVMSLLSTKLLPSFGRNVLFCLVFFLHLATFILCLLWQPKPDSVWMIYLLAVCLGSCDGTFANALQGMIAIYFEDRLGIAFSVKNFANNIGIVAGTGWSTSLCVYIKLYVLIGLLFFSFISYICAEIYWKKREIKPCLNKRSAL